MAFAFFRFWHLTDSCLWFDEIFSVHAAEHSWNSLFAFIALDLIHPPLFYVLLKVWIGLGGESLFWLRLFPVLFSVLAVFPFTALCRELKVSAGTQAFALFLFATNGTLIKYSQEVRMYSLFMCISLFSIWLFARYFRKGKSLVSLVIVNVILIYIHYFGWLVIVTEVAAILAFQRIKWRPILIMLSVSVLTFLPWAIAVKVASASSTGLTQNIGWIERPGLLQVITTIFNLFEPFYYQASNSESMSVFTVSLPILMIVLTAAVIYATTWRSRDPEKSGTARFLLMFTVIPVVSVFFASWILPYSFWGTRHLVEIFAPLTIMVAVAVTSIPVKGWRVAFVTLIVLLTGYGFVIQASRPAANFSWCSWEPLVNDALQIEKANVYATEDLVAYHAWFAQRKVDGVKVGKLTKIDGITEDFAYFLPRGFDEVKTLDVATLDDDECWVIFRAPSMIESEPPVRNMKLRGYRVVSTKMLTADDGNVIAVLFKK